MTSSAAKALGRRIWPLFIPLALSLLIAAMFLPRFYWPAAHGLDVTGQQIGRDFINNWAGPKLAFSGRLATLFDLDGYVTAIGEMFGRPIPFMNWGYPPFTLIAFWPLAQLPYFWALAVWTFGLFAAYAWTGFAFVERKDRPLLLVVLLCAPATIINTVGGQNGFLSASLLIGGVLLLQKRPILAGVLFGLLTFKPQLGLVLPVALIVLGAWRTIASAVVTTAALVGASILVFGLDPWRHYLGDTSAFQLGLLQDLHGFYPYMMTSVLAQAHLAGLSFNASAVLQGLVSVPVLLIAGWSMRWTTDPRRRAFILAAAAPLITPYAFNYDLTAVSLAIAWRLVAEAPPLGRLYRYTLWAAWLIPLVLMPLNLLHICVAPLFLLAAVAVAVAEVAPRGGWRGWISFSPQPGS